MLLAKGTQQHHTLIAAISNTLAKGTQRPLANWSAAGEGEGGVAEEPSQSSEEERSPPRSQEHRRRGAKSTGHGHYR